MILPMARPEFLDWMVNEAKIEPHVPVWDRGEGKDRSLRPVRLCL